MPRPKRTKVAPSIPANQSAQLRRKLINPKEVVEDISDEGEGRGRAARNFRRSYDGDKTSIKGIPRDVIQSSMMNDSEQVLALTGMKKRRDSAVRRLEAENDTSIEHVVSSNEQESSSPAVEVGRRAITTPVVENSLPAFGNFRRRTRQPSILGRKELKGRSSSVESDLAVSHGLANVPMEGSVLARGTLKRRPRQPSILGRGPSRVRSSSLGLEMDRNTSDNGNSAVRPRIPGRRSRQPGTLRSDKQNQQKGLESDYDDEDDFNPDDESTPLNLSKTRETDSQESHNISLTSNPRKRKFSTLHPAKSSSPVQPNVIDPTSSVPSTSTSPLPAAEDSLHLRTPERLSDTMASPRSSSSPRQDSPDLPFPTQRTDVQQRGRSLRRGPVRKPLAPPRDGSLPSSPPSLTHSPNRGELPARGLRAASKSRNNPGNMSTIQLQALLPRRRRRQARDTFDIESSDDGEVDTGDIGSDDDDLTHLTTRTNRTTRSTRPQSIARLKPGPSLKSKAKADPPSTTSRLRASSNQPSRSRHPVSDKENASDGFNSDDFQDVDPDDSLAPLRDTTSLPPEDSQELERRVGKELKTAKRKFEVVDKWELEFEDVTAESSSPWDAR